MQVAAFLSYIFLSAFTPGPNNIMAMSNAARLGLRRALVFCLGVLSGFSVLMLLCAAFTSLLYRYVPVIAPYLKWVGAAYILLLAWMIWRDKPAKERAGAMRPGSYLSGVLMQFVNVKVILYGITAFSTFILPVTTAPPALIGYAMALALVGFAGTCCWALFGAMFQRVFERYRKILNAVMALLLVYCAVASVV